MEMNRGASPLSKGAAPRLLFARFSLLRLRAARRATAAKNARYC